MTFQVNQCKPGPATITRINVLRMHLGEESGNRKLGMGLQKNLQTRVKAPTNDPSLRYRLEVYPPHP